jgi:hypothetical protein
LLASWNRPAETLFKFVVATSIVAGGGSDNQIDSSIDPTLNAGFYFFPGTARIGFSLVRSQTNFEQGFLPFAQGLVAM